MNLAEEKPKNMDVRAYNRKMWDKQVESGNAWTVPVSPEVVAQARQGVWSVGLTEIKQVPRDWFPDNMAGLNILGLACGGGQQGPIFAALGAKVTIFDNSPRQLERDREVAEREGLAIATVEGDMRDLSIFADGTFDLVFNPVSNCFIHEVRPVWREAFRVLRPGGALMTGFNNPAMYLFDYSKMDQEGVLEVRYKLPFDARTMSEEERLSEFGEDSPLEFSHSLDDLIGGQLEVGFVLVGFYEDSQKSLIGEYMPAYIATRAIKPEFLTEDE
jgi:SAM-dependent methyltransferase